MEHGTGNRKATVDDKIASGQVIEVFFVADTAETVFSHIKIKHEVGDA
jgi:hypothetical protein